MTPHDMKQIHIAGDNTNKRINMDWFFDRIVRGRTVPIPGKPFGSPSFILYFIRTCMHACTYTYILISSLPFSSLLLSSSSSLLFSFLSFYLLLYQLSNTYKTRNTPSRTSAYRNFYIYSHFNSSAYLKTLRRWNSVGRIVACR